MLRCPLCRQTNIQPSGWVVQDINYQKCFSCGFIFIARPILFNLQNIYNADYSRLRAHDQIDSSVHRSKLKTAEGYLQKILFHSSLGSMLDIGCSTGAVVAMASKLGWRAYGMDINQAALSIAQSYIPKARFYSTLDHVEIKEKKFSLITLFDVIEHIEDLHEFIQRISFLLDKNGVLFILTPDAHSLSARLMKSQWPHLFMDHISLFSRKNLIQFLRSYHFNILESGFAWKYVSMEGLYRHASCHFREGRAAQAIKAMLSLLQQSQFIFPFNIGECYIIAQKYEVNS